jgi:hypothetical protein
MDSFDAQGGNYMSIKVKKGNEVEAQKLFSKYKDHQGKYIRETKVESKLMKLSDIEIKTNPTNIDNYKFKLPGDFWIKYPDQIKHLMSNSNSESTDELPHKVTFDVKKENYQTVIKYFEQNGGINYYVHDTSNIGIYDVDPIIGFYDSSHKNEIIDKHNLKFNAAPVNFDLSNPEEVKNNIPTGSFGVVYDFNKNSMAIPKFPNTSYSIIGVPVRVEDKLTYLLISQYFDEKEKINHYGKVLVIYTPDEEKLNLDQYLELDTKRNSTFVDDTKWVKDDSEYNIVVETLPQKLKEKIRNWREAAKNVNNEKDLESLVTEVREYIQQNNNYGKSDVLNKIINDSDFKVIPIFKALAENMEKTNKEKISCYTANFLEQVILSTMDMGVYINTGYADFDGDGILRANERHAWTVVALRNDKGYHKLKIFDATPDRKAETLTRESNEQIHYGPFVLVITGGVLTIWLAKKAKKSIEDFEKLHKTEYPYPNNPPTKITELATKLSPFALHLVVSIFAHEKYSSELILDSNSISSYIKSSKKSEINDSWFDINHLHKLTFTNAELKLIKDKYTKIIIENTDPVDHKVLEELISVICRKISLQNNLKILRNSQSAG